MQSVPAVYPNIIDECCYLFLLQVSYGRECPKFQGTLRRDRPLLSTSSSPCKSEGDNKSQLAVSKSKFSPLRRTLSRKRILPLSGVVPVTGSSIAVILLFQQRAFNCLEITTNADARSHEVPHAYKATVLRVKHCSKRTCLVHALRRDCRYHARTVLFLQRLPFFWSSESEQLAQLPIPSFESPSV